MHPIEIEAAKRILFMDGAMATMIQPRRLTEADFRNKALKHYPIPLKGNNDLLNITRPDIIKDIHWQYLLAGADILSTNTFGANRISQADYDCTGLVYDINYQGAKIAKQAVWQYKRQYPGKPLFVAGSIGPTTKLASISPEVNNPGFRAVHFDQLTEAYTEQAKALIAGGVDLFLLETITDTLNAKAALYALMQLFDTIGRQYPIMISGTITDASGRILSGQTVEAFLISISHAPVLSVGLNCALGAKELRPYIEVLNKECPFLVSTHPNAGLPNQFGGYDQSAEEFATWITEFATNGWLNIAGGCCGTTPDHIAAAAKALRHIPPRQKPISAMNRQPKTHYEVRSQVDRWINQVQTASHSLLTLKEYIGIVARVTDTDTFMKVKAGFEQQRPYYHAEQARLMDAHLLSRYWYLQHTCN